jgi:hypothetical protein
VWSPYQAFVTDSPTELKREEVLKWFGNQEEFLKFHQLPMNQLLESFKLRP